jgi:hypothetical protein
MSNPYFTRACPYPSGVERVRGHLAHGYPEDVLRAALEAAKQCGTYTIEQTRNHRGLAADRALVIIQAIVEELEGIAAALAEWDQGGGIEPAGEKR